MLRPHSCVCVCVLCSGVDDWMSERSVDISESDEVLSMVVSVLSARHSALKLFLDRCVVTLGPDTAATPSCDLVNGSEPHPSPHIYTKTEHITYSLQMSG